MGRKSATYIMDTHINENAPGLRGERNEEPGRVLLVQARRLNSVDLAQRTVLGHLLCCAVRFVVYRPVRVVRSLVLLYLHRLQKGIRNLR